MGHLMTAGLPVAIATNGRQGLKLRSPNTKEGNQNEKKITGKNSVPFRVSISMVFFKILKIRGYTLSVYFTAQKNLRSIMGTLRFPNAVSDIEKFIDTFGTVYANLRGTQNFTHDDARDVLISHGLVSSSGAIGQEAVVRSVRDNRSLDPLYNQLKMYSEVYRMLGWYRPGSSRTNFNFTEISDYVTEGNSDLRKRLYEECLLGITFPNHLVENRSETVIRPFSFLLRLMQQLNGIMFRDEIILSVLNLQDDTVEGVLEIQTAYIQSIRGDWDKLQQNLSELATLEKVQANTLQNYTRFPLGSLKYTGWAEDVSNEEEYQQSKRGYQLTDYGNEKTNVVKSLTDIRHEQIAGHPLNSRAAFTLLSHYVMLERVGYPTDEVIELLDAAEAECEDILNSLGVEQRNQILYSPVQQGTKEELDAANKLAEKLD